MNIMDQERPPTVGEMIEEIAEYEINNMSWAEVKGLLFEYYVGKLSAMPPEALSERYDCIFNRY